MKESGVRSEQDAEHSSGSRFDCFLKNALKDLYERRAELNRLIRRLDAVQRRTESTKPARASRASSSR